MAEVGTRSSHISSSSGVLNSSSSLVVLLLHYISHCNTYSTDEADAILSYTVHNSRENLESIRGQTLHHHDASSDLLHLGALPSIFP